MNWFRVDPDIVRHPKLRQWAALLDVTITAAIGHYVRLLAFVAVRCPDGKIRAAYLDALAEELDLALAADRVVETLVEVGLLDKRKKGFVVHGFYQRNGRQLREMERKRKARERARTGRGQGADAAHLRDGTGRDGTGRDENRHLPYEEEEEGPATASPPHLSDRELEADVLGALLEVQSRFEAARADGMTSTTFRCAGHALVFQARAAVQPAENGHVGEAVVTHLRETGDLDVAGGPAAVFGLYGRHLSRRPEAAIRDHWRALLALQSAREARDALSGSGADRDRRRDSDTTVEGRTP